MNHIEPARLRELRKSRKWTQNNLGEKSKINVQTISRLERGESGKVREGTVEKLCKAFGAGIDADILAGKKPIPDKMSSERTNDFSDRKSQINHRISDASRNAMWLVAMRYKVRASGIYEIAPYLFLLAAEESLRNRKTRLEKLKSRWKKVEKERGQFPHLSHLATHSGPAQDIIMSEEESIKKKDLFGLLLQDISDAKLEYEDYYEEKENPFTVYLSNLSKKFGGLAEFDCWAPGGSPEYTVFPDLVEKLVGGNKEIAHEILTGNVALHEMPKDLLKAGMIKERANWVVSQANEKKRRFWAANPELAKLLDDTIDTPETSS